MLFGIPKHELGLKAQQAVVDQRADKVYIGPSVLYKENTPLVRPSSKIWPMVEIIQGNRILTYQ